MLFAEEYLLFSVVVKSFVLGKLASKLDVNSRHDNDVFILMKDLHRLYC